MEKGDVGSVVLFICVLAFAVIIVDERLLRAFIAFVPALLLAQRALKTSGSRNEERVGAAERRGDPDTRSAVDQLLRHIREFYLTCHLMGSGRMSSEEALAKAAQQEKELNRLLAQVTDGARSQRNAWG